MPAKLRSLKLLLVAIIALSFISGCGSASPSAGPEFKAPAAAAPSELKLDKDLSQPPKLTPP